MPRISAYSEPLDQLRREICAVPIGDHLQRERKKRQFFRAAEQLIQEAQSEDPAMDALDEGLKLLMDQARQLEPSKIPEKLLQREILQACLGLINQAGKLWRPNLQSNRGKESAYEEAELKIYEYFGRNHQKYDPSRAKVMTWLNRRFEGECKDQLKKLSRQRQQETNAEEFTLDKGKTISQGSSPRKLSLQDISDWIETEPSLKEKHIKNHPKLTIAFLLRARYIDDQPWQAIQKKAQEIEGSKSPLVPVPTLSGFYQDHCIRKLVNYQGTCSDVEVAVATVNRLNPCQHINNFLKEKGRKFGRSFKEYVETNDELKALKISEDGPSAYDILIVILEKERLSLVKGKRLSLTALEEHFKVPKEDLMEFYTNRIFLDHLKGFIHNFQEN